MNRWSFVGGLTVTLLLLLVLSGFCLWATRGLTDDLNSIINENYDRIRAVRELRSALTRLNAQCLVVKDAAELPAVSGVFRQERGAVEAQLGQLEHDAVSVSERQMVTHLRGLCRTSLAAYDELFALNPEAGGRRLELNRTIIGLTGDIGNVADQIVYLNENVIMARRDDAVIRGRRVTVIALGFVIFSLGIYVITAMRLDRGVFEPLRRLRDSIQLVSARRFETVVPIEGGEELGQIAGSFNDMARELQRYIGETDDRAVMAGRMNRAILETLPYPVYIVDGTRAVRQANPRAEALSLALGIPGALPDGVGRQVAAAAAANHDIVSDDIRRAVHLPTPEAGAGDEFLPQIFRMTGAFGAEDGWAVLLVDVTRLRRNVEAKTKALATLSHEVKTPVAGIRMTLHLLLEEKLGPINADQRELLEASRDDCEKLLAVLQALLELARLESGRVELRSEPHAPADLLGEAMAAHGERVRQAGGELVLDAPADLPTVLADPLHADRVLGNFISNAGKYGRPGRPVVLRARGREDGYVRLSVINHGRPLDEKEQARVFDPFFRRPGENSEGVGLGLAICREIAVLQGGRVGVACPAGSDLVEFFLDLRRTG